MSNTMSEEILVFPRWTVLGSERPGEGYACKHAVLEPRERGLVILCEECTDAYEKGAKIRKMKEEEE